MRYSRLFFLGLVLLLLMSGCKEDEPVRPVSLLDKNRNPEVLIFDADKNEPEKVENEADLGTQIVLHPNMEGESKQEYVNAMMESLLDDNMSMKILSKYCVSNKYYVYLQIDNLDKGGKHITLNTMHFDEFGQLYQAEANTKYVLPGEPWLITKTFTGNTTGVKWVFKVTKRK